MDVNELFKNFLEEIEQVVSLNVYNLWFSKIRPISLEGNTLKIVVPMDIHKSMLSENYKEYIDKAFINITGKTFNIEYFTEDELQETKENKPNKEVTEDLNEEWVTNLNPKFTFESFVVGDKYTKDWKRGFTNYQDANGNNKIIINGLTIPNPINRGLTVIPYEITKIGTNNQILGALKFIKQENFL